MPCYNPRKAIRDSSGVRFAQQGELHNLKIPCGQCIGCRLKRSREWALRCIHEAKTHRFNSFVTLTYNDNNLPQKYFTGTYNRSGNKIFAGNLRKDHPTKFIRRLRKALSKERGAFLSANTNTNAERSYGATPHAPAQNRIRFYLAGEYGDLNKRPHYHLCLFGVDFADKIYHSTTDAGFKIYTSKTLDHLWPYGFASIGQLTFETAAYTARYIMKKINGEKAAAHYRVLDHDTGELIDLLAEYNNMSRANGIGKTWFQKYHHDAYPEGEVVLRGYKVNTPRYYDKLIQKQNPEQHALLKRKRQLDGRKHPQDHTTKRLKVQQQVTEAKLKLLRRKV